MIRHWIILPLCALSLGLIAAPISAPQSSSLTAEPEKGNGKVKSQLLFRYKGGLLSGDAKKQGLHTVLSALSETAKLTAVLRYQPESDEVVSFSIKDKLVAEALKEILRGYNYVYIPGRGSGEPSKLILLGKVSAEVASLVPELESIQMEGYSTKSEYEGVKKKKLAGPWGLDELRQLKEFCKPVAETNEHGETKTEISEECRDREALEREDKLARALDALDTDYRDLKEAALHELKGINDPEATNALLNIAMNGDDKELQQIAAEALWQHAADLGFNNLEANQALKVLANEGSSNVKDFGQKALEDAKRYAKHVKEGDG